MYKFRKKYMLISCSFVPKFRNVITTYLHQW